MKVYKIYGTEEINEKDLNLEELLKGNPESKARKFYEYALKHSFNVKNNEKEYFDRVSAVLFKLCEDEEFTKYFNLIRKEIGKRLQENIDYPSVFIALMRPR